MKSIVLPFSAQIWKRQEMPNDKEYLMPRHGKNFRKALEAYNPQERFSIEEAVSKSLSASFAKFDETVDVAIRLVVDP